MTASISAPVRYYGLLHIDRDRNSNANIKWTLRDHVDIYISCAALLAKSATALSLHLALFTNEKALVEQRLAALGLGPIKVIEIPFTIDVPRVKKFYSAHFKIDVIKALATGRYGALAGLIDADTVFMGEMPPDLSVLARTGIIAYDVSSDVFPLHYDKRIRRDLELIAGCPIERPRWFGGEFLVAAQTGFAELLREIEVCWPRYVENVDTVHHVGDEMAVSAALHRLALRGVPVIDGGERGCIARRWSWRTKYRQLAFSEIEKAALVHLPADKKFLATEAVRPFSRQAFSAAFKAHLRSLLPMRRIYALFDPWLLARIDDT